MDICDCGEYQCGHSHKVSVILIREQVCVGVFECRELSCNTHSRNTHQCFPKYLLLHKVYKTQKSITLESTEDKDLPLTQGA